ncbi:hypothetical protein E7X19_26515, partial [Bacteroides fragilis]
AVNVYGQESEPATYRLAKMNLAIRGISYHLGDRRSMTLAVVPAVCSFKLQYS